MEARYPGNVMSKRGDSSPQRLLILSCSQKKKSTQGLLPALERYDGPAFAVMNKFIRVYSSEVQLPDVYILSAKFGLISADKPIPDYDHLMTSQRAQELQEPTLIKLEQILNRKEYKEFFISMGKGYLKVLEGYQSLIFREHPKVSVSQGSMGRKLAELRNWLYSDSSTSSDPDNNRKIVQQGDASIRGIEITLTPKQVKKKINKILNGNNFPEYQVWYVQIGSQRVPLKWLVSQLTGLSVSNFHTNEARRFIRQLGIEVYSRL